MGARATGVKQKLPSASTVNVGFIGLGRMGQGMARRILGGGHNLAVHDVVMSQTADLVARARARRRRLPTSARTAMSW